MVKGFLGNTKAANHKDMVETFLDSFHAVGCSVSINVPFLKGHLNEYPANLGDMSDEHAYVFIKISRLWRRDIKVNGTHMMVDYCWSIQRDCVDMKHSRRSPEWKSVP